MLARYVPGSFMAHDRTSSRLSPRVSIVIVDDHALMRNLLSSALGTVSDFTVVGEAGDAESAIDLCAQLRPDIVLLDSLLPRRQGPEAVAMIIAGSPRTRVMMISGTVNPYSWRCALQGGARGFLPKSASLHELVDGIRAVHAGALFIGKEAQPVLRRVLTEITAKDAPPELSNRERDVLAGIARGLGSKQIASNIGLSVFTVENHRRRISKRTGLNSVAGLTLLALELGLIPPIRVDAGGGTGSAKAG